MQRTAAPAAAISALAVFTGSFLLFMVQPMLGRTLLPGFGGSAAVWTACLVAYQLLLLVGYGYAHGVSRLAPATQRRLHVAMLALAFLWSGGFVWLQEPVRAVVGTGAFPSLEVVVVVSLVVGLPYVLLASGSTLIQAWLAAAKRREGGDDRGVYRLYAVSNLGSFLGLFVHPLLLEPWVPIAWQWRGFAAGLLAYALLVAAVAVRGRSGEAQGGGPVEAREAAPASAGGVPAGILRSPALWFALPCASSFFLVATTNQLTLDICPMALMWAAVLGLFLLSYVVGFSGAGERLLPLWMVLAAVSAAAMAMGTIENADVPSAQLFVRTVQVGLPAFFFILVFLHAWLYAIRPGGGALTKFYLGNASGGAVGGIAGGVLAPACFDTVAEYPLGLVLVATLVAGFVWKRRHPKMANGLNQFALLACLVAPLRIGFPSETRIYQTLFNARGFHGAVSVRKKVPGSDEELSMYALFHGRTEHGFQVREEGLERRPTSYYTPGGGGIALNSHPKYAAGQPIRFAGLGLGIGVMAAYGREGDAFRFFEISPEVIGIATNAEWFTFTGGCRAKLEIVEGDARKSLETEAKAGSARYDVLVVDTFSGDSIPLQMATDEAFDLYRERLAPGGILAVHISNWQFDLYPLCKAQMKRTGLYALGIVGKSDATLSAAESSWVFFSERPFSPVFPPGSAKVVDWAKVEDKRSITDDRGSLLPFVMRFSPLGR